MAVTPRRLDLKHISVSSVISQIPLNVSFRRALVGDNLVRWNELVAKIVFVQLDNQNDSINWVLSEQGAFSVKSMYRYLVNQISLPLNKTLWKLRLPLKNKIFNWLVLKGVILTKDNLLKKDGRVMTNVVFVTIRKPFSIFFF